MSINVFCLPFAGGSRYSYNILFKYATSLKWIPLEYPGRGARVREEPMKDLNAIVRDIFGQIKGNLNTPYVFYGHSMGAMVAFLLTKEIERNSLPMPLHLFLTGRGGPSIKDNEPPRYLLPKDQFAQKLRELGGSPEEILNSTMLMEFYEPILRADFEALETYQYESTTPVDVPISVTIGLEERVSYDEALAWQLETFYPIEVKQFPGKHFFILDYPMEVVKTIVTPLLSLYSHKAK